MARSKNSPEFEIEVDGEPYIWRLHRQPQWSSDTNEWRGMALAARHKEGQREAVMEFPPGPQRKFGTPQLQPALIDAETGQLSGMRPMPWYVQTLFLSQPLHFGDYGGMPLKILWALFTIATIVVLVSGIYLWVVRKRGSYRTRQHAIRDGEAVSPAAAE